MKRENMELVLSWRIKPEVSKFLFTKVDNDLEKQYAWFDSIIINPKYKYWIIYFNDIPIGVVNIADIDMHNSRCNAGFYIGENSFQNLGGVVLPYFYNYIFNTLEINKIYGEVVDGNDILRLHLLHGYRLAGTFKDHIKIDGAFRDVHLVELLKIDWNNSGRYKKYIAEFI